MAHKYQLDDALATAMAVLDSKYKWPVNLDGLDFTLSGDHNIAVVNLARLLDRPKWLPVAFLGCCSLDSTRLIRGFQRVDGTLEQLAPDDLTRALVARSELVKEAMQTFIEITNPGVSPTCPTPK